MPQKNSAKFAFFYVLSLVALLFTALSTGMIIFQIINKQIADFVGFYEGAFNGDELKFAISALVIAAPIYYLMMRQIYKNLLSGELEKDSGVRKWLTYFILLVSSVVMIGWLIAILNSFLNGDLTIKFILKAVTALVIAATIFSFYFYDIKREDVTVKNKVIKTYFFASLTVIVITFIASLFFVESPTEARNRKIDTTILNNLSSIDGALNGYYVDNSQLPANLKDLQAGVNYLREENFKDPITGELYEYKILQPDKYEICANFRTSNRELKPGQYDMYPGNWVHDAGHYCFQNKIQTRLDMTSPMAVPPSPKM